MTDSEPIAFPPLCDAVLDAATVDQLFADLAGCTEVIEVLLKGAATARAGDERPSLAAAREPFVSGQVRAVQVRYRHAGDEWIDTLMHTPRGVRLVRVRCPAA